MGVAYAHPWNINFFIECTVCLFYVLICTSYNFHSLHGACVNCMDYSSVLSPHIHTLHYSLATN